MQAYLRGEGCLDMARLKQGVSQARTRDEPLGALLSSKPFLDTFSSRALLTLCEMGFTTELEYKVLYDLLRGQNLNLNSGRIVFEARVHGFEKFHKICDGVQHGLLLARTEKDALLGAYSSSAFVRGKKAIPDQKAFILSVTENSLHPVIPMYSKAALIYDADMGPIYGEKGDLRVSLNEQGSAEGLGYGYQLPQHQAGSADAISYLGNAPLFKFRNYFYIQLCMPEN
jgi:hypothetical protein